MFIFILTIFGGAVLDSAAFIQGYDFNWAIRGIFGGIVALYGTGYALDRLAAEDIQPEAPSKRMEEMGRNLAELQRALAQVVTDIELMRSSSAALEERIKIQGMSQDEKDSLITHLNRRDRSSTMQNLMLFGAGVAAGVLTNILVK